MTRTRIWCDTNPTPHGVTPDNKINFPAHDYMAGSLGFEQMFMVYNGTLNRAPTWAADNYTLQPTATMSREGNFSNPPAEFAVKACAKLALAANTYQKNLQPHLPMVFDIENASTAVDAGAAKSITDVVHRQIQMVRWAKNNVWNPVRVGSYCFPNALSVTTDISRSAEFIVKSGMKEFGDVADFMAPGFYNWNDTISSPQTWFDYVETTTTLLDEHFSHLPRIAVVCPTYAVYWNDAKLAPLNDTPLPVELWNKQLRFLTDRRYELFIWTGNNPLSRIQQLLDAAGAFLLT